MVPDSRSKSHEARSHESHVVSQFGARAASYVSSAVHASGEDLQQIADLAKARQPLRALDMGCGGGHVSFHVAPFAREMVAYDLSADMLNVVAGEAAKRGLSNLVTQQGSVETLPFPDASFDFVASRYSAHHWHNVGAGLAEARRVLKPGGVFVIADSVSPGAPLLDTHLQALELLRDPSHVRSYSVAEWTAHLKAAGFVPGAAAERRIHLEFTSWVTRMATPDINVQAIRSLQRSAPSNVRQHFEIAADGSFWLDTATIAATL